MKILSIPSSCGVVKILHKTKMYVDKGFVCSAWNKWESIQSMMGVIVAWIGRRRNTTREKILGSEHLIQPRGEEVLVKVKAVKMGMMLSFLKKNYLLYKQYYNNNTRNQVKAKITPIQLLPQVLAVLSKLFMLFTPCLMHRWKHNHKTDMILHSLVFPLCN